MLIGYARISTTDQTLALQHDALTEAGCEKIFTDTASGSGTDRPALTQALSLARAGDTLVVWRLDRLGRSLRHLIETVQGLQERGAHFQSLEEHLDIRTSGGTVFGALAKFERDLVRQRAIAGLVSARARGKRGGPRRKLDADKLQELQTLAADRANSVPAICKRFHISRATFYRYIKE